MCVCLSWGCVHRGGVGAVQLSGFMEEESVCLKVTSTSTCYGMLVLCMFACIREREIQGVHSPPRGLLSSWLGLCQAIWGAPVLYGARVKNGNANK